MEWCCSFGWVGYFVFLIVTYKILDFLLRRPTVGEYADRYIVVTGCDSGFGQALARRLDRLGCHVFAGCLSEAGQVQLEYDGSSRLHTFELDVTNHNSILQALNFVKSKLPDGKG
jgi:11-cis-retinol dehydrogenase